MYVSRNNADVCMLLACMLVSLFTRWDTAMVPVSVRSAARPVPARASRVITVAATMTVDMADAVGKESKRKATKQVKRRRAALLQAGAVV